MSATKRKATGSHFTPPALASLLAERLVALMTKLEGRLRVLDPACGDGNLLIAIAAAMPDSLRQRAQLIGIEQDDDAFAALRSRRPEFLGCSTELIHADFLDGFEPEAGWRFDLPSVDVIIANPPYVRTQVLGAERAQQLAKTFGLSGRVDLYQAFLVAMANQLRPGGLLGVITSNRFLMTKAGTATRRFLRRTFELLEIIDLGDTKLFDAAVLPAVVLGEKQRDQSAPATLCTPSFIRVYESHDGPAAAPHPVESVVECLRTPKPGAYQIGDATYRLTTGWLPIPADDARPWTMLTSCERDWIHLIHAAADGRIGDVAKVRVGIKTTADRVFIRRDWDSLPDEIRPDELHLRALLSQEDAAKWRPASTGVAPKKVLYTHEVVDGRRRVIRFDESGATWRYLTANQERLQSRRYVSDAGRKWYEIWVPQDPAAWALPKIVFPDISPDARFFWDQNGCVVDGNCYWMTTNDPYDEELLLLILGVANSSVLAKYHDLAFQNRLYARRRRHLTQYIAEYPLPPREHPAACKIPALVRRLVATDVTPADEQALASEVDALVASAFGIDEPLD